MMVCFDWSAIFLLPSHLVSVKYAGRRVATAMGGGRVAYTIHA